MRVLIRGQEKKKELFAIISCGTCDSILEISKDDCHVWYSDSSNHYETDTECPVCNKQRLYLTEADFKHEKRGV